MNDSAPPNVIAADWLVLMDTRPLRAIRNGGVRVSPAGTITAVGPLEDIRQAGDCAAFFADCVLTPGLVNAHTHLDLGRMEERRGDRGTGRWGEEERLCRGGSLFSRDPEQRRNRCAGERVPAGPHAPAPADPAPPALHDWVLDVMAHRQSQMPEQMPATALAGARQSLAAGVTTVMDVTPCGTWVAVQAALAAVPLRHVALLELIGFDERGRQQWDEAERIICSPRAPLHPLRGLRVAAKQENAGKARPLNEEDAGQAWPHPIYPSPSGRGQAAEGGAGEGCSAETGCPWQANIGLSPHAPYSTSPEIYHRCLKLAGERNWLIMTHLSETREDIEFCRTGGGPWRDLLESRYGNLSPLPVGSGGGDEVDEHPTLQSAPSPRPSPSGRGSDDDFSLTIPHCSPIAYMHRLGLLDYDRALLAHVNYLEPGDLELLAVGRATVVYCPRSAAYFGHRDHPWRKLLAAGVNVAIGTDSLASCPDLSILNELRFLHERYPDVPVSELFALATRNAWNALPCVAFGDSVSRLNGRVAVGALADLVAWPIDSDGNDPDALLRSVIESSLPPRAVFVAGQQVCCP